MIGKPKETGIIPEITDRYRSILVFGPPGSGKGTVGQILGTAGCHCHLSSGDIFRKLHPESPAGLLFYRYANKGLLLPDSATVEIWYHYVHGLIATNRYFPTQQLLLLDGIPRTQKQAELLDQHIDVRHIIVLETENEQELIHRIQERAQVQRRKDDMDSEVLKTRLEVYRKDTAKVLRHYPSEIVSVFNADQPRLDVLRDILMKLSTLLNTPLP